MSYKLYEFHSYYDDAEKARGAGAAGAGAFPHPLRGREASRGFSHDII